jgi:hypothetical protein
MKRLLFILLAMCFMSGCLTTGQSTFPVQIISHEQALSGTGFAARMVANYIKLKYPAEVKTFLDLSNQVVNADTDAMLEEKAQILIDELIAKIKDPEARIAVMALRDSFEIDIDTSKIVFDPGARQTVLGVMKIIKAVLEN